MNDSQPKRLPPRQQKVGPDKWPFVGEGPPEDWDQPWTLSIAGECATPLAWSLEELRSQPRTSRTLDIHCVTRWSKFDVTFVGVRLVELLSQVQASETARFASFIARSDRHHSTSLSLSDIYEHDPLIAWEVDDQPLSKEHGGPLRLVTPGKYFYKSLKWLERIELLSHDRLGYWEQEAGYHNHADPWREERYIASQLTKKQVAQLLEVLNFEHLDLLGFDGQGRTLNALKARGAKLRDANFEEASLVGADFRGANLSNANLRNANLQRAIFDGADLEGADLSGANLAEASLLGASLFGANFVDEDGQYPATFSSPQQIHPDQLRMLTDRQRAQVTTLLHGL
jgi:DMSO/TMAO reductase YedYZ molybdopterin-dependent catalytic subunit